MKPRGVKNDVNVRVVAPLAGAWIETVILLRLTQVSLVAPLAGAWIETRHPDPP